MVYTSYYWNYHSCNLGLDVKGDLYFMEKIYVYMVCTDYHVEEYGGFLDSHFFFGRKGLVQIYLLSDIFVYCSSFEGEVYEDADHALLWLSKPDREKAIDIFSTYYRKKQKQYEKILQELR